MYPARRVRTNSATEAHFTGNNTLLASMAAPKLGRCRAGITGVRVRPTNCDTTKERATTAVPPKR